MHARACMHASSRTHTLTPVAGFSLNGPFSAFVYKTKLPSTMADFQEIAGVIHLGFRVLALEFEAASFGST